MKTNEIRESFLNYFEKQGHMQVSSSSVVPQNDPTLLFTNAGMVQFKDIFTGKKTVNYKRATTSQKCIRAGGKHNDLENVGYTARHHTFFEMLGNFSFGDYFKKEAIAFAWDFVTRQLCLDPKKLCITVHATDDEAWRIWKQVTSFDDSKIIKIPTNDNFWSMGATGPCGPCSEIFYDHGENIPGGMPGTAEADGDRFVEIWNLVFMQFETLDNGTRINLPKPSIDTGMGLERIAAVMQGVHSNFQIDLFQSVIADICKLTTMEYSQNNTVHYNVIADHIRAITFMISDGIIPSNEGRGYVLRRIIRRALRHGYALNLKEPFLYKLVPSITNTMGCHYSELQQSQNQVMQILKIEEQGFMETIEHGMSILQKEIDRMGNNNMFPPDVAYKLYDTFGFPVDLTQDVLKSVNKTIDTQAFDKLVLEHKKGAKNNWIGTNDSLIDKVWYTVSEKNETVFVRNTYEINNATISSIVKNNELITQSEKGEEVYIVLDRTPFYATSGGQICDIGKLILGTNVADVLDTVKIHALTVHKCVIISGAFSVGDTVIAKIDKERRLSTSRNHTATHLLHKALREILGIHIFQQGSLVAPDKLRFDFCHYKSVTEEEIVQVEKFVLTAIDNSLEVKTEVMNKEEAIQKGAMALFNEKYPDSVRVVTIGENLSKELCGGEHVRNTAQIESFKIVSSSSIGSQIQRIEAITGQEVKLFLEHKLQEKINLINQRNEEIKILSKKLSQLQTSVFIQNTKLIQDGNLQYLLVKNEEHKNVLSIIDKLKTINTPICALVGNQTQTLFLCLFINEEMQKKVSLQNIINSINNELNLNISIPNRKDLLQVGGIDITMFNNIVNVVKSVIN